MTEPGVSSHLEHLTVEILHEKLGPGVSVGKGFEERVLDLKPRFWLEICRVEVQLLAITAQIQAEVDLL